MKQRATPIQKNPFMPTMPLWGKINQKMKTSPFAVFTLAAVSNFREVGACCPSSPKMAKTIASKVNLDTSGLIVELGAGTGSVTHALLKRGVGPERLVVVEKDPHLALFLTRRFPKANIINGNATDLYQLLGDHRRNINTIVSSLPLFFLPIETVNKIGRQLTSVLSDNGRLVQYTYQITRRTTRLPESFRRIKTKLVWLNLPPARVDVYKYNA